MPPRDNEGLVKKVLSDPDIYPDEFKSWITRFLQDNLNMVVSKQQIPGVSGESWRSVGDTGQPAFQNSWVNYGGLYAPASFTKDYLGFVHVRGMIKSGTLNTAAFTLPAGYRPEYRLLIGVDSNGAEGRVEVTGGGDVIPVAGNNAWFQLDNFVFRAFS